MENKLTTLEYRNEDDKAYGLAGMIITLSALDALELVQSVSLDSEGPMVEFSQLYYRPMSPSVSAKSSWETMRRNYYVTTAMVVGNVMARSLVRDGNAVEPSLLASIHEVMVEEGNNALSLEEDEIENLYRHLLRQNMQIFHNPRLYPKVQSLSRRLSLLRTLSLGDIATELEML